MHLRVEPRFTTETSVVLQRLRRDSHQLSARILDVSGVGFRLLVQEALTVGEPLRILTGDYKLLVMVRYSVPVENGHSVGVERIDAWLQEDKAVPAERRDPVSALGPPELPGISIYSEPPLSTTCSPNRPWGEAAIGFFSVDSQPALAFWA